MRWVFVIGCVAAFLGWWLWFNRDHEVAGAVLVSIGLLLTSIAALVRRT